jgi:tellurite resistance protein
MSFWSVLQDAFAEGADEGAHGAPTDLLIDAMMIAAKADRHVQKEEMRRIATLLTKHFRAFHGRADGAVMDALHASVERLAELGDPEAQLAGLAAKLKARGDFASEKGFALAYAVLLADGGLNEHERAFADRLRVALGLEQARADEIERDLDAALSASP